MRRLKPETTRTLIAGIEKGSGPFYDGLKAIRAPHAFQAVMSLPFEAADGFAHKKPLVVPARTLLSQLL